MFIQSTVPQTKKRKRGDELTDRVRILYWYRFIGREMGTLIPSKLHRLIEHGGIAKHYGESPNSRYLFYSRGEQLPRELITTMVESKAPGATAVLNHVLWRLLREDAKFSKRRDRTWLAELAPEIRGLATFDPFGNLNLWLDERTYRKIERRASLDALALLTLLIRIGIEEDAHPRIIEASAKCLQHVLLILGPDLDELGLSHDIFDLFLRRIGIHVLQQRHLRLVSTSADYIRASRLLYLQAKRYADSSKVQTRVDTAVSILRGNVITALTFTHEPVLELDPDFLGPLPDEIAAAAESQSDEMLISLLNEGLMIKTCSGRYLINYLRARSRFPPTKINR